MVCWSKGSSVKRSLEHSELRSISDFLDLPISRISGEFVGRSAEHAFLVDNWPMRARMIRLVCVTTSIVYLLSISLDVLRHDLSVTLVWSIMGRIAGSLAVLTPLLVLRQGPTRKLEWTVFFGTVALSTSFNLVTLPAIDRLMYMLMTVVVILIGNYMFMPNRFVLTVAAGVILSLEFLGLAFLYSHAPLDEKLLSVILLAALHAIGIYHLRSQNRAQRGARIKALALEQAIERRAMAEEKAAANRARNRFFLNISHELGTPLNSIVGFIELIDEDLEAGDTSNLRDDLDSLRRGCFRLQRTVGNVLELSRIESGQLEVNSQLVALDDLIGEVFEDLRGLAEEQGNQVFVELENDACQAWADPSLLRHCLTTLLDNANRFTQDGEVLLTTKRTPEHIQLRVQDTGVGIETEKLVTLFQPFSRSSDACESLVHQGSGVSLAVANIFCRRMNASIEVESKVDVGTTFTLLLPHPPGRR